jgi:nicotinate-nucleotide pyrophosphorylase (carboxylating)
MMKNSSLLSDNAIARIVEQALREDIGLGDVTTEATVPKELMGVGKFLVKGDGVIAGLEIVQLVFAYVDNELQFYSRIADGSKVKYGDIVAVVAGRVQGILTAERVALNFLQRMSGIATTTSRYVEAVVGLKAKIVDTRKTVPGLRALDKLAVKLGGGSNHRFGLDDMVLIKDNHIVAAGGIRQALERCKKALEEHEVILKIEVETKNLAEVEEALTCGDADIIMLDNFSIDEMRKAVELIGGKVQVEASGGVTLDTVRAIAETGVDIISVGALTHSVKALDISLEVEI